MNRVVEKSIGFKKGAGANERGRQTSASSELFSLELPACSEYLGRARRALTGVAEELHLSLEDTGDLLLAAGEACNNAVQHSRGAQDATLRVRCRLDVPNTIGKTRALQVEITNTGNGFLPSKNESIFKMPEAEELGTHGRGLPLMFELMDDVQVLCENGNTVVRLTKKISRYPTDLSEIRSGTIGRVAT